MLAHCRKRKPLENWVGCQACVMGFHAWDDNGKRPFMGEICFHVAAINAGVVSHEMTHATVYWALRKGLELGKIHEPNDIDEKIAWTQGYMVSQFWERVHKMKDRGVLEWAA